MKSSFEQPTQESAEAESQEHQTPERLLRALETMARFAVSKIEVKGENHLAEIPPDAKVIIATTHISDADLPIVASVLGRKFDISITTDSVQHTFKNNPLANVGLHMAGKENFSPISYDMATGKGKFKPKDFEPMVEDLEHGKTIVMAGHSPDPEKDPKKVRWALPDKGAIGPIYLAIKSGAVILPVAVNIKSKTPVGFSGGPLALSVMNVARTVIHRPEADVIIGKPITFPNIEGLDDFSETMTNKTVPANERLETFRKVRRELDADSDDLMESFSEMLPAEKRGRWGEETPKR